MAWAAACSVLAACVAGWVMSHPSLAPMDVPGQDRIAASGADLAVLDGGTLRVGSAIVRLSGISAASRGTVCHGDRLLEVDCGSAAAKALTALVHDTGVDCAVQGHDQGGLPIADCQAGPVRVSQMLVQNGWARATEANLQTAEDQARAAQRGMWRSPGQS